MSTLHPATGARQFFRHFVGYLGDAGYSRAEMLKYVWQPHHPSNLHVLGPQRDLDFSKLTVTEQEISDAQEASFAGDRFVDRAFYSNNKTIIVLVPGFTHETLKNLSLHEEVEREDSPHEVLMLSPGAPGEPSQEKLYAQGAGFKLVYARYPRSNADSAHVVPALFDLLHNSVTLRRWVEEEGYRLFFMGYSYGCPLSLELLAGMNSQQFPDEFILKNTQGMLALCGAIGGSYLADDVMRPDSKLMHIPKLVERCRKYPWLSKLAGMPTRQFQDDMEGGVRSLTRAVRQQKMAEYASKLPANLHYFSVSAVLPLSDYKRRWWQFNLDDYTMWLQAKVSDPISIYNDGQVVMTDNLIPHPPHIPAERIVHLGAVRAHHWAVSYKTFNLGKNDFPRRAFYKALMQTVYDTLNQ
ncbi:MAG TPA: hypothetical protein VGE55_07290 [Limnobacter sp.]|uniref:hypothetical protein n=1 Tax=Limnobacter sp. TaxID=2003368 RepID=UPI002ED8F873